MLNSSLGSALRDYPAQQQTSITDLVRKAAQARQGAYGAPAPAPRTMTPGEALIGALAALVGGRQTGEGFASGLEGAFQNENQRRQMQFEQNQRGQLAQAQGFQDEAALQQNALENFQKARQFEIGQRNDREQNNRRLNMQSEQFNLGRQDDLRRDDERTRQFNAELEFKKNQEALARDAAARRDELERKKFELDAQHQQVLNQLTQERAQTEKELRAARKAAAQAELEYKRLQARYYGPNVASQISAREAAAAQGAQRVNLSRRAMDLNDAKFQMEQLKQNEKASKPADVSTQLNTLRTAKNRIEVELAKERAKEQPKAEAIKNLQGIIAGYDASIADLKRGMTPVNPVAASGLGIEIDVNKMAKDRKDGYDAIRQKPDKAAAIRKRFKDTYGVDL